VLHILDGIKVLYHGGPGGQAAVRLGQPDAVLRHRPGRARHIGWKVIDDKAGGSGKPRLVDDKPDNFSHFVHRQPEHVEIAGALGLGEWDEKKIDLRRIALPAYYSARLMMFAATRTVPRGHWPPAAAFHLCNASSRFPNRSPRLK